MVGYDFSDLTSKRPEKSLTLPLVATGGRNNKGRITSRFRGGGHKKLYRIIDFRGYDKLDIPGKILSLEYDPNRAARIALVQYADGEKRYVLARKGSQAGDTVMTGPAAAIKDGSRKQLKDIPEGLKVFNIELTPFTKGKLAKSAGNSALVAGRDEALGIVYLKLPSGEMRKFNEKCRATLGQIGNEEHKNIVIGKAGRMRWLGFKPRNNGLNMNPVDHPHG
jgi:large subunit ribosomal protein L2